MYYKSVFSVFTFILIIMLTIAQPAQCDSKMIVVADEGTSWNLLFPTHGTRDDWIRFVDTKWQDVQFTLKVEYAISGTSIVGDIQHGYGAGPFDVELTSANDIQEASITPFSDHIAFRVVLSETVPEHLIELFTVKPVPNTAPINFDIQPTTQEELNYYYHSNREGEGELPFRWNSLTVTNQENELIEVDLRISEELEWYDVGITLRVRTSGFDSDVIYVGIHEIHQRTISNESKVTQYYLPMENVEENLFQRHFSTSSFNSDRPITFEVRLANGESYFISTNEVAGEILITPTTAVTGWIGYSN